ncbi:hypothetical protein [Paracoccus sp. (in: a-proteobacteria)]|uniref:hypothetical protein n=1 Tax=Paracoccus sp. TaxID=267 RepID=UPI0035AE2DF7
MKNSERNTTERQGARFAFPAAAGAVIWKGTMVALNAGNAAPGAAIAARVTVGIADLTVDNTGGAAGALMVPIKRGTFLLANSAGADEITNANYGQFCHVVDNDTVALTNGGGARPVAGTIRGVSGAGVWVEF